MNKHVAKLQKDASDARRQIEDSDSDSSDSEEEGGGRVIHENSDHLK